MKELILQDPKQSWTKSASIFVFEGVKDHFKGVVGAALGSGITAVVLYVWSGQAPWVFPAILSLLSFLVGVMITLVALGFIGFRSVLKTRQQAAAFAAGLESKDKGFFDYFLEMEGLQPEFTKALSAIGNEMTEIAKISGDIDLAALTAKGPKAIVDGLAHTARGIIKHASLMAGEQDRVETLIVRMTEATGHQVQSAFISASALPPVRDALSNLLNQAQVMRNAMTDWRAAQQNAYGLSQEWNTAMNHTLAVTDRILTMLETSESRWSEQLATIDSRLLNEIT
jgi:hypothetical protein